MVDIDAPSAARTSFYRQVDLILLPTCRGPTKCEPVRHFTEESASNPAQADALKRILAAKKSSLGPRFQWTLGGVANNSVRTRMSQHVSG